MHPDLWVLTENKKLLKDSQSILTKVNTNTQF